jgi:hypothetical protein
VSYLPLGRAYKAEIGEEFGNQDEGKHRPLEAVCRRLVKILEAEKSPICALVNCSV